jgi:hypothetical protein
MTRRCAAAAAALLLAAACAGINAQTHSFNTLEEARQAGVMTAGWLPEGLPPGTRDIRTAHVPDSRDRWGLFNFPPSDAAVLKRLLSAEEVSLAGQYVDVPGRIEWWPVALRGGLDAERIALTGLRAYRTSDGAFIMAVQWSQGRAYFWSPR